MDDLIKTATMLVVDAAKGYVTEQLLAPALRPVWELVKATMIPRWDQALGESRFRLTETFEKRQAENRDFVARLQQSLKRGEADALATQLVRAAAQSTTEERMRMLAAAVAGVLTPDFISEMRSRVARGIEQLEPSDIVGLRRAVDNSSAFPVFGAGTQESTAALAQVGALMGYSGGKSSAIVYEVTPVGRAILKTLELWQPDTTAVPRMSEP